VCLDVALWHASERSGLLLFIVECQLPSLSFIWEQSEVNIEGTVESVMMDIFFFIRLMYFLTLHCMLWAHFPESLFEIRVSNIVVSISLSAFTF
jgi:hypothetical protein